MKLFIGVGNSQYTVPSAFHWSWEEMEKPYEYDKRRFSSSVTIIRDNRMIRDFLRSDCNIFVKMDIDQVYPKDYFTVMVPLVRRYKVIGPMIYNKWRRNDYAPLLCDKDTFPTIRNNKNWHRKINEDGILKVPYAHSNLFCAREVLENIKPPWIEFKYSDDNCAKRLNGDYSFTDKIKEQGYTIHINTNIEVGHLVEEVVDHETYTKWTGQRRI